MKKFLFTIFSFIRSRYYFKLGAVLFSCFLVFLFSSFLVSADMDSTNYQIWADVISVGGLENSSSTSYRIKESTGEAAGRASSTNYSARAGFQEMVKDNVLTLTVSASSLSLGELSNTAAKIANHTLTVYSTAPSGVSVTYSGATLTCATCSGANTITGAGATAQTSQVGHSQFGLNAIYSSGSLAAGSVAPYNTAGSYAFSSGGQIISGGAAMGASSTFTINYLANISGAETAGSYSASITYTATANF